MEVSVETAEKTEMFVQCEEGGLRKVKIEEEKRIKERCLGDDEAKRIAELMISLEIEMETPQDFEWGIEKGKGIQ